MSKLKTGTSGFLKSLNPVVEITGKGKQTYLWIGNNHEYDRACYATLSGEKTLEKIAVNILKALKSKKLKP